MDLKTSLAPISKALAGALAALVVAGLAQIDWRLGEEEKTAVELLINGGLAMLIGYLTVYLAPKNKEVK